MIPLKLTMISRARSTSEVVIKFTQIYIYIINIYIYIYYIALYPYIP